VTQKICTITATGEVCVAQPKFECFQCGLKGKLGVCQPCKEVCHDKHELVSSEPKIEIIICDCGESGNDWCLLSQKEQTK